MDVTAVVERVQGVAAVRASAVADRAALEGGLRSVAAVRAWLAAAEAELAARLAETASFPEKAIADAGRGSQGEAGRVLERSGTLGATPSLAGALNDGAITAGHVDAVTKVAKGLDGAAREALLQRADQMVGVARHGTVSEYRQRLEREADRLRADDGVARFQRQQRAARLRRWVDADGMWCLAGRFDPLTGVRLNARLNAEVEAAFAEAVPDGCPTDPQERQSFLAASALARLIDGSTSAARTGRPEFVVVIEADPEPAQRSTTSHGQHSASNRRGQNEPRAEHEPQTGSEPRVRSEPRVGRGSRTGSEPRAGSEPRVGRGSRTGSGPDDARDRGGPSAAAGRQLNADRVAHGGAGNGQGPQSDDGGGGGPPGPRPRVDWGLPVEVPWSVMLELFGDAHVSLVVVRNGVVLHAPGQLDLGRTTRLANRAQRRALRALYPTCGVPECEVHFDRCKIHHLVWWRHGGRTDLANLVPLCVHHHRLVHLEGWLLVLDANRRLTIHLPDGTVYNTGPPRRRAA